MRHSARICLGAGLLAAMAALAGCTVGPNYHRPTIAMPTVFRGAAAKSAAGAPAPGPALGNERWWQVYHDPVLRQLIRTALRQNYDLRIAASRVLQAQAQLGLTRANQYPTAHAGAEIFGQRNPKISKIFPAYTTEAGALDVSVLWDLDFWGKYRRETEVARDQLAATVWGRRAIVNSVVTGVATAYFQLRELDLELAIAQRTLASRRASAKLTQVLTEHGSASELDLRQAQELVYAAAEAVPDIERQQEQEEDQIAVLLGENPSPIPRPQHWQAAPLPAAVPAGLPSALLERRPDIREAEAQLMAANADIGVAKADFFPNISLSAEGGLESNALNRFLAAPSLLWNAATSATQVIFDHGALQAGLQLTQAEKQQMLLTYRQTILTALQQTSDALIAYQKDREFARQQALLTAAARDADHLSEVLYQHGGASFLQVLTSQTNYFAAQLALAQARLNERLSLVQLYNALGGGWRT